MTKQRESPLLNELTPASSQSATVSQAGDCKIKILLPTA
jgi:hypothetical protein